MSKETRNVIDMIISLAMLVGLFWLLMIVIDFVSKV